MRRLGLAVAAGAVAFACSLTACAATRTSAQPASLDGCVRAGGGTTIVGYAVGGAASARRQAAVLGSGRTGVVLANQSDRDLCAWLPFARSLAAQGVRPFGPRRAAPSLSSECGTAIAASAPSTKAVAFTAGDGAHLHGERIGNGDTTIVLAHEYPSSLCGWFPYAGELAGSGFSVFLFDHRAKGSRLDLDVVAAVEKAKALGATKVIAMGGSLGGAATLVAAGRDCFLVSGIVSVSGETDLRSYGRGVPPLDAVPYESRIAAPLLVVGSKDDSLVPQADVDQLLAHAASASKRAVLVDGYGHGWNLLQGPGANPSVRRAVIDFLNAAEAPVPTGCF